MATSANLPSDRPGDLLGELLGRQVATVESCNAQLQTSLLPAVHDMRVALRRLRTALTTFGGLLAAGVNGQEAHEVQWLTRELGPARDAQVLGDRLTESLAQEPPGPGTTQARSRIDSELAALHDDGLARARRALESERYASLFLTLRRLREAATSRSEAAGDAELTMSPLVLEELKRLGKRARRAQQEPVSTERDVLLHDLRKTTRRARYATEALNPLYGERTSGLVSSLVRLQTLLGERQDATVAGGFLSPLALTDCPDDPTATYARLQSRELAAVQHVDARLPKALRQVQKQTARSLPPPSACDQP